MQNKELLSKIMREYENKRVVLEEKRNSKIEKAYSLSKVLKEIDERINKIGFESMRKIMATPKKSNEIKKEFEKQIEKLKKEREKIIKDNNIDKTYNEYDYECPICKDTGFVDNKRCKCFEEKIIKENIKDSNLGVLTGDENFEDFDLSYYDDKNQIIEILNCAKDFVNNFDNINYNVLFHGNTGLGKTFLSSIIANNILKKGKSVIYLRATKMFYLYQDYRFRDYSLSSQMDAVYNADLLVIDDLGSENTNKEHIAFLFDLINERLLNNKKTIINTNLELSDITKNYSVRLTSRIYESFKIFEFSGKDIRIQKLIERGSK